MCLTWRAVGLLLVVPWLAGCMTRPEIRLDTGQGPQRLFTPPSAEPPPVQVRPEEFTQALAELVLHLPMRLSLPERQGRVVLASWGGREEEARHALGGCEGAQAAEDCLVLPANAPPPRTLARMRLALSFALDTVWEGASVALSEAVDPLAFKVTVYSAMVTYLLVLMMPEPVTKGVAVLLTVYLVAYLGLGPVWALVEAGWQLLRESEGARTAEELKGAGHRFGRVLGDNGTRVLLLLATAALGGKGGFKAQGPKLPGYQRAALSSPLRTGVRLAEAAEVKTMVVGTRGLVLGLAPTAVAATALGPGEGGAPPPGTKGSLTGRPTRIRLDEDPATQKAIKRENESAQLLAEKGYHVEQNPPPPGNGKKPDYKINGDYYDCMAPSTSSARNIAKRIQVEKVDEGQASRIVLNLDDSGVALDVMRKQLLDWPIPGLQEVIAIRNGKIVQLFP